jgi:hypothetical protein
MSNITTLTARFSSSSRNPQRVPIRSLAVTRTFVRRAYSASASRFSILSGSSNQYGPNGSSALAISMAVGGSHSEWNSTWMSMSSPTARRIFSNGRSACFSSALVMRVPLDASAYASNGQIFMPW